MVSAVGPLATAESLSGQAKFISSFIGLSNNIIKLLTAVNKQVTNLLSPEISIALGGVQTTYIAPVRGVLSAANIVTATGALARVKPGKVALIAAASDLIASVAATISAFATNKILSNRASQVALLVRTGSNTVALGDAIMKTSRPNSAKAASSDQLQLSNLKIAKLALGIIGSPGAIATLIVSVPVWLGISSLALTVASGVIGVVHDWKKESLKLLEQNQ